MECITIEAQTPQQQIIVRNLLEEIRKEFPHAEIRVTAKSKKLTPEEVILLIFINVTSEILFHVLDKLWNSFARENIQARLWPVDHAQEKAEAYLRSKETVNFAITKREDRGLYVFLVYQTTNHEHVFHISKSTLEIIRYEQRRLS